VAGFAPAILSSQSRKIIMLVHTIKLSVKCNANTQIATEVAVHELEILRAIHGEGNIYDENGEQNFVNSGNFAEIEPVNELKRLLNKYPVDVVTEIFGSRESQFIKLLEGFEVTPPSEGNETGGHEASAPVAAPANRGGRPRNSAA
jgi:hypothetical protein